MKTEYLKDINNIKERTVFSMVFLSYKKSTRDLNVLRPMNQQKG